MAGTVSSTILIDNGSGQKETHAFPHLTADEAKRLMHHLVDQSLKQVINMIPGDPDDKSTRGDLTVTFSIVTLRDSDNSRFVGQSNDWPGVNSQVAAAIKGTFDSAMAKLDKQLAGKHKKK